MGRSSIVSQDRGEYEPGNERLAHATVDGETVTLHNYRDSVYALDEQSGAKTAEVRWATEVFDLQELTNVWAYFGHFAALNGVAHAEVGFEFADGRVAVASFEIRPLVGQSFHIIDGMRNQFELSLRWGTEREMQSRRFIQEPKVRMYMFEADITYRVAIKLFHAFVDRTNELYDVPEWYHTTRKNCASSIVDVVDQVLPGHVRSTHRVMLPGMLPKYWAKRGFLKFEGDFAAALEAAFISERASAIGDVPDFSIRLHGRDQLL